MRFATAILDFSVRKGGAERYLVEFCRWMVKEGHEVHVFAERWDEEVPKLLLHRVKTIPFPKSLRLLSFAIRATREIERGDYDVSLGVGNTLKADFLQPHGGVHWAWFWRSLRAYDNPLLQAIKFLGRILSPKQWVNGWIESYPYRKRRFYKIIAISDMVKKDIIRWYGIPDSQIEVIYNGVDTERFNPRNRIYREEIRRRHGIGDEFLILFVSNNFRMKGLDFLLRALAEIKKDGSLFKLLILGRDRKRPYLHLAKRLGLSKEVIFAGPTDEPEKYFGAADLLVHPTFYDACSLTVIEAMASGLPVITTISNGSSGLFKDGKERFLIDDPRNIQTLCERINFIFKEKKRGEGPFPSHRSAINYSSEKNHSEILANLLEFVSRKR